MMAKRAIDASQQFDYRNDRLRGGRERSSAEWGTRRCSPQTGMAELGGIKLGRMKLYSTAKGSPSYVFLITDFALSATSSSAGAGFSHGTATT
jgi:hypothetical protein